MGAQQGYASPHNQSQGPAALAGCGPLAAEVEAREISPFGKTTSHIGEPTGSYSDLSTWGPDLWGYADDGLGDCAESSANTLNNHSVVSPDGLDPVHGSVNNALDAHVRSEVDR